MTDAITAYKEARAAYFAQLDGADAAEAFNAFQKAGDEFRAGRMASGRYFEIRRKHEAHQAKFEGASATLADAKERAEAEGAEFCETTGDLLESAEREEKTLELFA